MRLVQIYDEDREELWNFPDSTSDKQIQNWYIDYIRLIDEYMDSFEQYMEEKHPEIDCERVFVDEIFINYE